MGTFDDRVNDIINAADEAGNAARDGTGAPWMSFKNSGEPVNYDVEDDVKSAFDRSEATKEYSDAVLTPGQSFRKAQAGKIKSDVLSALERDSRARHRSRVRMMAHTAAKLISHGQSAGPMGRVIMYVNRLKEQE